MNNRGIKNYILLALKGMGMGAADVVPGVSGGTIAFISGIYEELINSIKSINLASLKVLLKGDIKGFWNAVNGNFLASVFAGIAISVLSLARILKHLLDTQPIMVWSFFFGLILASAWVVSRKITKWKLPQFIGLIAGIAIAYYITIVSPAETTNAWWFLILSGAVAICAMILPGISGAFILLLLGKYAFILDAVSNLKIEVIALVGVGAVAGLLSFSNLLSFLLRKYHDLTIAILSGFMIGSLNKVWPWKEVVSFRTNSHGEEVPFITQNISPETFDALQLGNAQLGYAIALAAFGFSLIFIIEFIAAKFTKAQQA